MRILISARAAGKTYRAAQRAIETGSYLVVRDRETSMRLSRQFPEMRFPVTYDELLNHGMRGSNVRDVVIDDADEFLRRMFHWLNIKMITMNFNEGVIFERSVADNPNLPKEYVEKIQKQIEELEVRHKLIDGNFEV